MTMSKAATNANQVNWTDPSFVYRYESNVFNLGGQHNDIASLQNKAGNLTAYHYALLKVLNFINLYIFFTTPVQVEQL